MQLIPELKEGGLERAVIGKSIFLQKSGHSTIIISNGGIFENDLAEAGIEHMKLPVHLKNPFTVYKMGSELAWIVKQKGVDVIHSHSRVPSWSGFFASKRTGVPFITTAWGLYEPHFLSRVMCSGDKVIAVSSIVASHLVNKLKADRNKIQIIYPALCPSISWESVPEIETARGILGFPVSEFIIGYVGRLTPLKGPDDLVEGFAHYRKETGSGLLAMFGDVKAKGGKHYHRLSERALSLGVSEYIRFMGFTKDVHLAYAACNVIVVPTRIPEGFGLTIIEAILCGTPVIAVEGSGALEIMGEEAKPLTFPPQDPKGIGTKLIEHYNNPGKATELLPVLQDRLTKAMDPETQYEKILEIYQNLVKAKKVAASR
jgi:glycosyltransferase involved in cell wall biosynthesis